MISTADNAEIKDLFEENSVEKATTIYWCRIVSFDLFVVSRQHVQVRLAWRHFVAFCKFEGSKNKTIDQRTSLSKANVSNDVLLLSGWAKYARMFFFCQESKTVNLLPVVFFAYFFLLPALPTLFFFYPRRFAKAKELIFLARINSIEALLILYALFDGERELLHIHFFHFLLQINERPGRSKQIERHSDFSNWSNPKIVKVPISSEFFVHPVSLNNYEIIDKRTNVTSTSAFSSWRSSPSYGWFTHCQWQFVLDSEFEYVWHWWQKNSFILIWKKKTFRCIHHRRLISYVIDYFFFSNQRCR